MLNIEYIENFNDEINDIISSEFNKFAIKNNVVCNYISFNFVAKENDKIIGVLTGHSYYKEIYVSDIVVFEKYRNNNVGKKLIESMESYYKDKGFENINLTTYKFQAPGFYEKCGFKLEFVRENKTNQKLTKYFFVKYF